LCSATSPFNKVMGFRALGQSSNQAGGVRKAVVLKDVSMHWETEKFKGGGGLHAWGKECHFTEVGGEKRMPYCQGIAGWGKGKP